MIDPLTAFAAIISALSLSLYVLGFGALLIFYILFHNKVNFLNTKNLRTIIIMLMYIFTVFYIFNFMGTKVLDFIRFIQFDSEFQLYIISFFVKLIIWISFSSFALHLLKLNKHLWVEKFFQLIFRK